MKFQVHILFAFLAINLSCYASHIVGGDVTYRFLGGNSYEITMHVFRNCADIVEYDNPASIGIYENGNLIYNKQVLLHDTSYVNANPPDPCFIPPAGICVQKGTYIDTVLLPPSTYGYDITYQRCCRNTSVVNILYPGTTGETITTHVPASNIVSSNNSPQFSSLPPVFICVGTNFIYSFGATDTDGDSLVYSLCNPLNGGTNINSVPNPPPPPPYDTITWQTGYSATNPFPSASGINFNQQTGQISFNPNVQGMYSISVAVSEYRNGVYLNTIRRDLELSIVICGTVASIPAQTLFCNGLNVNFNNNSSNATHFSWDFGVTNLTSDTSSLFSPSYNYPDTGTYHVMLVAVNTAYGTCKDTAYTTFYIEPVLSPSITLPQTTCFYKNSLSFSIGGTYSGSANINWNFGNHASPLVSNLAIQTVSFDTGGVQNITAIISQFGCSDTLKTSATIIKPIANANTTNQSCRGDTVIFSAIASSGTSFYWDFGVPNLFTDTSTKFNTTYTYTTYGNYTVTLVAYENGCSDTSIQVLHVFPLLQLPAPFVDAPQCLNTNLFTFQSGGIYSNSATFNWYFSGNPSILTSSLKNPIVHFNSIGNHLVTVIVSENGCTKQGQQAVRILPVPIADFISLDTIGCQSFVASFQNQSTSIIPTKTKWLVDNTIDSTSNLVYLFNNSGVYSITQIVTDTNHCSDTLLKVNYVKVLPKPFAIAYVTPTQAEILHPQIVFVDSTLSNHSTNFSFGDGQFSNVLYNTHTYSDTGYYNWQLVVANNYGCLDTAKGRIYIEGSYTMVAPNIFSPNDDNINDTWVPIVTGDKLLVSNFSLNIFNRWGILVYENDDFNTGWNGRNKEGSNCKEGVYYFTIFYTNTETLERKFLKGFIELVK